jgi:tight adherence protein B
MTLLIPIMFFVVQVLLLAYIFTGKKREKVINRVLDSETSKKEVIIKKKKKSKVKVKKIEGMLRRADIKLSSIDAILIYAVLQVISVFAGYLLTSMLVGSLILMVITHVVCITYVKILAKKRLKKFEMQLGDAIQIITNAMKAGYSFFQSLSRVVDESSPPISDAFGKVIKEMSLGKGTEEALEELMIHHPIEDLELMVTAIIIQREIGGNLADILDNILETIRERQRINREVKTLTAQGRLSGLIIMIMPIGLGVVLFMMNPEYILLLFQTTVGRFMLGLAVMNQVIGAFMINKIVKIDY